MGGVTVVGQPNLMTSQEFDNFCVNGVFFLARGSPSHTLHHFYRSHLVQDNRLRCPPPPTSTPLLLSKHTFCFLSQRPAAPMTIRMNMGRLPLLRRLQGTAGGSIPHTIRIE